MAAAIIATQKRKNKCYQKHQANQRIQLKFKHHSEQSIEHDDPLPPPLKNHHQKIRLGFYTTGFFLY